MLNEIQDVPAKSGVPTIEPKLFTRRPEDDQAAGLVKPVVLEKRWGSETLYHNSYYCMKKIFIRTGQGTSMHFHQDKQETLLLVSGLLRVEYINREGQEMMVDLQPGDALDVLPCFPHKLIALEDAIIIEASTTDHPWDSYRVSK